RRVIPTDTTLVRCVQHGAGTFAHRFTRALRGQRALSSHVDIRGASESRETESEPPGRRSHGANVTGARSGRHSAVPAMVYTSPIDNAHRGTVQVALPVCLPVS